MTALPVPPLAVDSDIYAKLHAPLSFAFHEAGHAVVARSLSIEVTGVALKYCQTRRREDPISCWSQAIVACAGPESEQRHARYPLDVRSRLWRGYWAGDRRNALHWLGLIRGVTMTQCEAMARFYVDTSWPAITRVAHALAEEGELSGIALVWRE
jgi:hypothetical protein